MLGALVAAYFAAEKHDSFAKAAVIGVGAELVLRVLLRVGSGR